MPIVSSSYWNQVHGNTPEEVKQDLEGIQTMHNLALNMAWLMKCIELGNENTTTEEAKNAMPYLAEVVDAVLTE